ncbi:MAG: sugar phosphate isomerase/epimerase [Isosphaeraceae bacterium]
MRLGYNTNGLAHHRLVDAIQLLADEGYQSVALTLDAGALDPYLGTGELDRQVHEVSKLLDRLSLSRVVETGARFLLNPRKKHDPTLMDPSPSRRSVRADFLRRSIVLARRLGADVVSLWSGALPDLGMISEELALDRLAEEMKGVLLEAEANNVTLAFEPEPGMFIDTFERFAQLDERLRHPLLQLTVDIGHVHCLEEGTVGEHLRAWRSRIANIHVEDMVRGVHEHLLFGEGTIDFDDMMSALHEIGYEGGLHVELSRHSHAAVDAVRGSAEFLRPYLADRLN